MLLVFNNFKEDNVGDDEKGYSFKLNIFNGSFVSWWYLMVFNVVLNWLK